MKKTSKLLRCLHCHESVRVPAYRLLTFRFCSRKCGWRYKAAHDRVKKRCLICRSMFEAIRFRASSAKYCSRPCYYKAMKFKGSIICKCRHCQKTFRASPSQNRKYCSVACVGKSNIATWRARSFTAVRKAMKRRGLIKACAGCGYNAEPRILGVHHKDQNNKNNALFNLIVLCPNCHSLKHIKHIAHCGG